jgi:hypothetical protein
MEIVKKFATIIFILLLAIPALYAQDSGSFVVRTEEGLRIFQTIVFPEVPNVARYEVEIERIDGDAPVLVENITTTVNHVEVSLRAGRYRYRFSAINRMNLLEGVSGWQEFWVLTGVQPVIESYQPFYGLFYEMANPEGTLIIFGSEFFEYTEFALVRRNPNFNWTGVVLENRNDVIYPSNVVLKEGYASLSFTRGSLLTGRYEIFARNPGGLWSCFGEVHVGYRKLTNFTLSFGYSPMIAGFDINNARQRYDGADKRQLDVFNPIGYYVRFGWLPILTRAGNFGLEAHLYFMQDRTDEYKWKQDGVSGAFRYISNLKSGSLNLLYQLPLTERWRHNIRLGIGYGENYHNFNYVNEQKDYPLPHVDDPASMNFTFGYSAQYFLWKNLFLEAGLDIDYTYSFSKKHPINHLMFRPAIGMGWQFGRWAEHAHVVETLAQGQDHSIPVSHQPKPEHIFSLNWHPMILVSGFKTHVKGYDYSVFLAEETRTQYLNGFNPLGLSVRYAYLPYRWDNNKLGFRFEFGILEHVNRKKLEEQYRTIDLMSMFSTGIMYQRVMSEDWHANVHAGIGISNPYNYHDAFSHVGFLFNCGISAQYFFRNNLFVEAGIDVAIIFHDYDVKTAIRPGIAIGYQINRNNETGLRMPGFGFPLRAPKEIDEELLTETQVQN